MGTSKLNRNIEPNPKTSPYFKEWVDYIIANKASYREAADWLNDKGLRTRNGKKFRKNNAQVILNNPVFCGIQQLSDHPEATGTWKALISINKYRELQRTLGERRKPRFYSHAKGYRGLMTCAHCGCAITCMHKIKNGKSYIYYGCTKRRGPCPQPNLTEKQLENQIFDNLTKIEIDDITIDDCLNRLRERHSDGATHYEKQRRTMTDQIEKQKQRLNHLLDMRLNKEIDKETYEKKKSELEESANELTEKRSDSHFNQDRWIENLENVATTCILIETVFNDGTIEERSELIKALGRNLTLEEGKLNWTFRKPWSYMVKQESDKSEKGEVSENRTGTWAI